VSVNNNLIPIKIDEKYYVDVAVR